MYVACMNEGMNTVAYVFYVYLGLFSEYGGNPAGIQAQVGRSWLSTGFGHLLGRVPVSNKIRV